ncbi:MAG: caspase family protein [Candidatus Desulfatibia sp.]|uniref:caspase family protein n=1 Tax=Candidatus Desulfatibia sp. TaxID=3101189 RepID=UPI002F2DC4EC
MNEIQVYLKRYPRGQFANVAQNRIRKLTAAVKETYDLEMEMWNKVKNSRNTGDFQNFLQAFPNGIFAGIAKSRIENLISLEVQTKELALWDGIKASRDPKDFEEYLHLYPQGQYADHARRLSRHLAALEIEREELEFWESVKESKNPADFDAYLAKYPEGRFGQAARKRRKAARLAKSIAEIDFGSYYALIVGNNDYRHLPKLRTAVNDAKAMAVLLQDKYRFELQLLLNATRADILRAINGYRRTLGQIDALNENQGILDATLLFSQIRRPVMVNTDQTPEYSDIRKAGHDGGDFLFVPRK